MSRKFPRSNIWRNIGVLQTTPLLAHCVKVSEGDIELIAESDSRIAHCPKSNAKFGHGIAPLEKFLDKKIRVGFGSDSVASNNTCDILEEARFAALFARSTADQKPLFGCRRNYQNSNSWRRVGTGTGK